MRTGIAFGSNLGDRLAQLRQARAALSALTRISEPLYFSSVFETEPIDTEPDAQPFLNAVAEVEFTGHPLALLDALHEVEASFGRPSKRPRNAPRAIDLDVLYAGNLVLRNEEIVIPHPRLHMRRFVLQPLCEIRPELILPGHELTIAQMLSSLSDSASVEFFAGDWSP